MHVRCSKALSARHSALQIVCLAVEQRKASPWLSIWRRVYDHGMLRLLETLDHACKRRAAWTGSHEATRWKESYVH